MTREEATDMNGYHEQFCGDHKEFKRMIERNEHDIEENRIEIKKMGNRFIVILTGIVLNLVGMVIGLITIITKLHATG